MSWNQGGGNDGGPWGGNKGSGGNPWGNRGNRGPEPDLDAMIRQTQEKLKSMLPGGGDGPKGLSFIVIIGLVVLLALQGLAQGHFLGFYRINDGEVAVVQRFGAVVRQEQPGLRWLVPLVERYTSVSVSKANLINLGVNTQSGQPRNADGDPSQQMMLTGDANIVDMEFTVQWRVSDPVKFLFKMREPDKTLRMTAESVVREVIGQSQIMTAISGSGRDLLRPVVESRLRDLLASYDVGIKVDTVTLNRMEVPAPVIKAFNDAQNAQSQALTKINEAEGYRNRIIPEARAEANRMLEEARAYKAQVMAGAQGDANRFTKVHDAYKQSESTTATRLYLETMEQVLGGANKVILSGGTDKVLPYLPLDTLRRAPAASSTTSGN